MTRINVHDYDTGEEVGWFDPDKATRYDDGRTLVNSDWHGINSGSKWIKEYIYRTPGGRWVLNRDCTSYCNGADTYTFMTPEQARLWLIRTGEHDEAVTELFGPIPDESGGNPQPAPHASTLICTASGTRVHEMGPDSKCVFCHATVAVIAL